MPKRKTPATIRAVVVARAAALDLSPAKLAEAVTVAEGRHVVGERMLRLFLRGDNPLSSDRLDAVFRVLGLSVSQGESPHR